MRIFIGKMKTVGRICFGSPFFVIKKAPASWFKNKKHLQLLVHWTWEPATTVTGLKPWMCYFNPAEQSYFMGDNTQCEINPKRHTFCTPTHICTLVIFLTCFYKSSVAYSSRTNKLKLNTIILKQSWPVLCNLQR